MQPVKRALLSVSDKDQLVNLATHLHALGIELLSTGGTSVVLRAANIPHRLVEEVTGVPEMLGGRVKTLHPSIHGGILADRMTQADDMLTHGITPIDLVVVNFYPFHKVLLDETLPLSAVIEEIDIGGPAMVRAAAKNMAWVGVVTDPHDYAALLHTLQETGGLSTAFRHYLALKAFKATAQYDAMVSHYLEKRFGDVAEPAVTSLALKESISLRYGENPHQCAKAFQLVGEEHIGVLAATVHQGKALSFNNLLDANAAANIIAEFTLPACVIVKHGNPCGAALASDIESAYEKALAADAQSAFGGIVAFNQPCSDALALRLIAHFFEVVIAPSFSEEALLVLASKPNLRVLTMPVNANGLWEYKFIDGGVLQQEKESKRIAASDLTVVTDKQIDQQTIDDMLFAWDVVKHIKSNAILIAKDQQTLGVGAGQVSRIESVDLAIKKAGHHLNGAVLASDAFFPFRDSIDRIATTGIRAIIQPGGSVKDQEVIDACNEHGIAMAFTGFRCFKH